MEHYDRYSIMSSESAYNVSRLLRYIYIYILLHVNINNNNNKNEVKKHHPAGVDVGT